MERHQLRRAGVESRRFVCCCRRPGRNVDGALYLAERTAQRNRHSQGGGTGTVEDYVPACCRIWFVDFGGEPSGNRPCLHLVVLLQPLVEQQFGLYLPIKPLTATEHLYVAGVVIAGLVIGLIPAWKAYRNALSDGLSVRV